MYVKHGEIFKRIGKLPIREISELSFDELGGDKKFFFRALIISDRKDQLELTAEDFDFLEECAQEGWVIYYAGSRYLRDLYDRYCPDDMVDDNSKSFAFGYVMGNSRYVADGFWNFSDEQNEYFETEAFYDIYRDCFIISIMDDIDDRARYYDYLNK